MYAIAEKRAVVGSSISRDNSRLWVRRLPGTGSRDLTPASDEALLFEFESDAQAVADEIGDSFCVVDFDGA